MKTEETISRMNSGKGAGNVAAHALERLIELRASAGDALNDSEFSRLFAPQLELAEEGFSIVGLFDGWVTLRTPTQDSARWCSESGWLSEEKEAVAMRIAEKYQLSVCEPPDRLSYMAPPSGVRHHLEMVNDREAVVIAHPLYLKIRLIRTSCGGLIWKRREALPPPVELFKDLIALYTDGSKL